MTSPVFVSAGAPIVNLVDASNPTSVDYDPGLHEPPGMVAGDIIVISVLFYAPSSPALVDWGSTLGASPWERPSAASFNPGGSSSFRLNCHLRTVPSAGLGTFTIAPRKADGSAYGSIGLWWANAVALRPSRTLGASSAGSASNLATTIPSGGLAPVTATGTDGVVLAIAATTSGPIAQDLTTAATFTHVARVVRPVVGLSGESMGDFGYATSAFSTPGTIPGPSFGKAPPAIGINRISISSGSGGATMPATAHNNGELSSLIVGVNLPNWSDGVARTMAEHPGRWKLSMLTTGRLRWETTHGGTTYHADYTPTGTVNGVTRYFRVSFNRSSTTITGKVAFAEGATQSAFGSSTSPSGADTTYLAPALAAMSYSASDITIGAGLGGDLWGVFGGSLFTITPSFALDTSATSFRSSIDSDVTLTSGATPALGPLVNNLTSGLICMFALDQPGIVRRGGLRIGKLHMNSGQGLS